MDAKKRNLIIGAAGIVVVVLVIVVLSVTGVFGGFRPKEYVSAILDQTLKGEAKAAARMIDGVTEGALYEQYETSIESFVKNSLLSGTEMDAELEDKYVDLCKKVFAAMKYEVQDAKETEDGGYEVQVAYQTCDIFAKFTTAIGEETQRLTEKVENGEYRGTLEEINTQMQTDFLNNAYTLFEECYNNMEYGEEEVMIFTIEKGEAGLYDIGEGQITEFIQKIMNLGEKQD